MMLTLEIVLYMHNVLSVDRSYMTEDSTRNPYCQRIDLIVREDDRP